MAVAAFDGDFSFSQETLARLGDQTSSKLTEEQQRQLKQSKAFQAQLRVDELLKDYSEERDKRRKTLDQAFTPEEADFSASKAYDYNRSENYYEVLGIEEYAPLDEVNRAYKRLSLVYHPDKTKGMTQQQQQDYETIFISVKNAHLVLGDQATRRQYDKDRDYDRAKELVSGVKVQKAESLDLTEVLKRINEMQRPPGKTVDVKLELDLEEFFYGAHKVVPRNRRIKDFYAGIVMEEHLYRLHVKRGAAEPMEVIFKEQGDHNADARPDTIAFSVTSRLHDAVERSGDDLIRKEEIQLGPGSLMEAYFSTRVSGLKGRQLLLWGQNPFFPTSRDQPRAARPVLDVSMLTEGLADAGSLRFRCRFSGSDNVSFSKQEARNFLKDLISKGAKAAPAAADVAELRRKMAAAARELPGEWKLIAQGVKLLQLAGQSDSAGFLTRNKLNTSVLPEEASQDEEACGWQRILGGRRHGHGGLCTSKVLSKRGSRCMSSCEVTLEPCGEELQLFTEPACSLRFYSNLRQIEESPTLRGASAMPIFAVCLSSKACSGEAQTAWQQLQDNLVPLLECSVFRLMTIARRHLPMSLTDFPCGTDVRNSSANSSPWKQLGTESFRQGHFWLAAYYYTRWLECAESSDKAVAYSNRAACFAKVKDFEASLADAQAAKELKPFWARPWARLGAAAEGLEDTKAAFQAYRRAVELEPTAQHLDSLAAASSVASDAEAEKAAGDAAFSSTPPDFGRAVACYTVAIGLHSAAVPLKELQALAEQEQKLMVSENRINAEEQFRQAAKDLQEATASKDTLEVAVLYGNRAAALCHRRCWSAAVKDARMAARLHPSAKAKCRLGVALLGAGQSEDAYVEFAWALAIDSHYAPARRGLEACLSSIPKWTSHEARRRQRLSQDSGRPRAFVKVWMISDLHYDHKPNAEWCQALDDAEFQDDVLIVAGNMAETFRAAIRALEVLKGKFRRVFYVPGNRDLALNASEVRTSRFPDSTAKLLALLKACEEIEVDVFPAAIGQDVFVVPLFSWYSAEFDKRSRPDPNAGFDAQCVWPLDQQQLWKWMLKLNEAHLHSYKGTVLTVSHFLPLTTLPFDASGKQAQAMGCEEIEDQLRRVRSSAHVYGHSTMRSLQVHGGTTFGNHAVGLISDENEAPNGPRLLFDGMKGVQKGNV